MLHEYTTLLRTSLFVHPPFSLPTDLPIQIHQIVGAVDCRSHTLLQLRSVSVRSAGGALHHNTLPSAPIVVLLHVIICEVVLVAARWNHWVTGHWSFSPVERNARLNPSLGPVIVKQYSHVAYTAASFMSRNNFYKNWNTNQNMIMTAD
jgi:hypothetical protein